MAPLPPCDSLLACSGASPSSLLTSEDEAEHQLSVFSKREGLSDRGHGGDLAIQCIIS